MKTFLVSLLACIAQATSPSLLANQAKEFSVFQPIEGISANIYINQTKVIVESTGAARTALKSIKPEYIKQYSQQLYKISDVDRNGTVDIATLDRVDRASTRFCYNVYSYHVASRKFGTQPTHTECNSAAGRVVYANTRAYASQ